MESLIDELLLAKALPAMAMAGGLAAALVAQCGKSRPQPVKQAPKKKPGHSSKSQRSRKSGKVSKSKSGKSKHSKRPVSKSSKSAKNRKSGKPRSSKSSKSGKSSKSSKSTSGKRHPRKPGAQQKRSSNRSKSSKSSKGSKRSGSRSKSSGDSRKQQRVAKPLPPTTVQQRSAPVADNQQKPTPVAEVQQKVPQKVVQKQEEPVKQPSVEFTNIRAEPQELRYQSNGGIAKVHITNNNDDLYAVKVKCSDNNLYRVHPVHFYLHPQSEFILDVVRQNGKSKVDKLVLVFSKATTADSNPKDSFGKQTDQLPMIILPLLG